MDKNLIEAHLDESCEKSNYLRIAAKAELMVEVASSYLCTVVYSNGTVV